VRTILGSDNFTYNQTPYFSDVPATYFAFKWIQKLKDLGLTAGCGNGMYCPGNQVTRDQAAIFLIRARYGATAVFDYPSTPYFTDVPTTYFAFPWIQRFKLDGITGGCGATTYCPGNPLTRGDIAILIMRAGFNQLLPPNQPYLSGINPNVIARGGTINISINGTNTHFQPGVTTLAPMPGITVTNISGSGNYLYATFTADANATPQPVSVLAITGTEEAVLPNGLVIQ